MSLPCLFITSEQLQLVRHGHWLKSCFCTRRRVYSHPAARECQHSSPHRNPAKARRYETDSSPGVRRGPFDPFWSNGHAEAHSAAMAIGSSVNGGFSHSSFPPPCRMRRRSKLDSWWHGLWPTSTRQGPSPMRLSGRLRSVSCLVSSY